MAVGFMDLYLALMNEPCEDIRLVMMASFNFAVDISRPYFFERFEEGSHGQHYSNEQV